MQIMEKKPLPLQPKHTTWSAAVAALTRKESIVLIAAGRAVLMFGACTADTPQMAALIRHSSGFVQTALPESVCDRLQLPEGTPDRRRSDAAANGQCVAVDAAMGVTTGISAADRARTARVLADSHTTPEDLTRPGHMVPVRVTPTLAAAPTGVIPALALALTTAACATPGAVYADLVSPADPVRMASAGEAIGFASVHNLLVFDDDDAGSLRPRECTAHPVPPLYDAPPGTCRDMEQGDGHRSRAPGSK